MISAVVSAVAHTVLTIKHRLTCIFCVLMINSRSSAARVRKKVFVLESLLIRPIVNP